MVVSLELTVVNKGFPLFTRFLAAYRLVKIWARMRFFDDAAGVVPSTVKDRGLYVKFPITRSKTSGPTARRRSCTPSYLRVLVFLLTLGWMSSWT